MAPRIPPGGRHEIGLVNSGVARVAGVAMGSPPPHIFTTLARHRGIFRKWLRFAGALMPGGRLPRADTELLILRVAHNTACEYEWRHHERIAQLSGLSSEDVQRVRAGADADGWSERQSTLLRAADELHGDRRIGDATWTALGAFLREDELIELCLLVGHYEMLAMTLNSLEVEPDRVSPG
ncbi:MAG: carboxymuconolactone decarboxylase family protein, partial [Actinomycetota bacterium]|nr:carboxymuconolactone decarboxylase family protein [Actinomycetota bacterium]